MRERGRVGLRKSITGRGRDGSLRTQTYFRLSRCRGDKRQLKIRLRSQTMGMGACLCVKTRTVIFT